jgi:hypothetical protein
MPSERCGERPLISTRKPSINATHYSSSAPEATIWPSCSASRPWTGSSVERASTSRDARGRIRARRRRGRPRGLPKRLPKLGSFDQAPHELSTTQYPHLQGISPKTTSQIRLRSAGSCWRPEPPPACRRAQRRPTCCTRSTWPRAGCTCCPRATRPISPRPDQRTSSDACDASIKHHEDDARSRSDGAGRTPNPE